MQELCESYHSEFTMILFDADKWVLKILIFQLLHDLISFCNLIYYKMCWGKALCINLSKNLQFKVNIITTWEKPRDPDLSLPIEPFVLRWSFPVPVFPCCTPSPPFPSTAAFKVIFLLRWYLIQSILVSLHSGYEQDKLVKYYWEALRCNSPAILYRLLHTYPPFLLETVTQCFTQRA